MGLEKTCNCSSDVDSIFDADTIKALRDRVCELANKEYKKEYKWGCFNQNCNRPYQISYIYDF